MPSTPGFELVKMLGGECSHHGATLAPQKKLQIKTNTTNFWVPILGICVLWHPRF